MLVTTVPSPAVAPCHAATTPSTESTTTIVIGSGFSGLAVAAELNRQGIEAIVVDSFRALGHHSPAPTTGAISMDALSERSDILRLLEHHARRHELDIRPDTQALELSRHDGLSATGDSGEDRPWAVTTANGTLTAYSIVFTRGALNQLRRVLRSIGVTTSHELSAVMASLGLYLVGVGDMVVPTTTEILHQAKRVGQSISAFVASRESAALAIA